MKQLVNVVGWTTLNLLLEGVARADNCGSLSDCFYTVQSATVAAVGVAVMVVVGVLTNLFKVEEAEAKESGEDSEEKDQGQTREGEKTGHVLNNAESLENSDVLKNANGKAECVELIKQKMGAPASSQWQEGTKITRGVDVAPGTAIATFIDGHYPNNPTGQHAAIYLGQDSRGIKVLEQYKNINGMKMKIRVIPWIPTKPGASLSNNGSAYSIILW